MATATATVTATNPPATATATVTALSTAPATATATVSASNPVLYMRSGATLVPATVRVRSGSSLLPVQLGIRAATLARGLGAAVSSTYPVDYGGVGTYLPSASTTGVPAGTTLTNNTGDITVTTAGTVLNGLDVHGRILVRAANVTIQRCIVRGRSSATNEACIDATNAACSNLLVQDCTLVPEYPSIWVNGINGHDVTLLRCNVYNVVDPVGLYNTGSPGTALNVIIRQNYFHDFAYFTPDSNHSSDQQTHNDGTQIQGGTGAIIQGNRYDAYYGTAGSSSPAVLANPTPSGATAIAMSCVLFNNNVGSTGAHIIEDNWFRGGYIPINCGGAPGVNLGRMWRNKFKGDSLVSSGTPHTITLRADQSCDTGDSTANQNTFEDTGLPVLVRHNG